MSPRSSKLRSQANTCKRRAEYFRFNASPKTTVCDPPLLQTGMHSLHAARRHLERQRHGHASLFIARMPETARMNSETILKCTADAPSRPASYESKCRSTIGIGPFRNGATPSLGCPSAVLSVSLQASHRDLHTVIAVPPRHIAGVRHCCCAFRVLRLLATRSPTSSLPRPSTPMHSGRVPRAQIGCSERSIRNHGAQGGHFSHSGRIPEDRRFPDGRPAAVGLQVGCRKHRLNLTGGLSSNTCQQAIFFLYKKALVFL